MACGTDLQATDLPERPPATGWWRRSSTCASTTTWPRQDRDVSAALPRSHDLQNPASRASCTAGTWDGCCLSVLRAPRPPMEMLREATPQPPRPDRRQVRRTLPKNNQKTAIQLLDCELSAVLRGPDHPNRQRCRIPVGLPLARARQRHRAPLLQSPHTRLNGRVKRNHRIDGEKSIGCSTAPSSTTSTSSTPASRNGRTTTTTTDPMAKHTMRLRQKAKPLKPPGKRSLSTARNSHRTRVRRCVRCRACSRASSYVPDLTRRSDLRSCSHSGRPRAAGTRLV